MAFKSGFVSIIGAPNVGKSTLLNALLQQKVAITSPRPQTTRHRIRGILHLPEAQIVFVDTPGIHDASIPYNKYMVQLAVETLQEVDVILFMIEPFPKGLEDGRHIIGTYLSQLDKPCILLINKVDKIAKPQLLPIMDEFSKLYPFKAIIPISAKKQAGLEDILKETLSYLPEGPQYYPEDYITDQTERQIVAEIIREKIIHATRDEIPYCVAVTVEEFREVPEKNMIYIRATIHVERDSQKGIIIGKRGQKLKSIGQAAREEIELILGQKVFLDLFVRVQESWRRDPRAWAQLGLKVD
ncbi:MAG: GTPase Era [Candidatus Desulfofervidaceae bacterium]|nr:GTPase Era [Candidatus Desulfofervidaceae bacterium]MDL1970559.1 GTPase Era [Candidatus Desulfofervidaceae bacterium]